ncbi:hypothetical protein [Mycobacterium sp. 94-17]|uniref:hypothetical protein n=1 Tax=Mycobacterium sp. 94-17 TaxID=2986147 RepID=UPI002D1EFD7F|nr:hypothetical protein [Mycobacterium sp. 94-17]MEB4208742.1 hypothetical protein [Mycobacterium sp. 94-17]
MRRDYQESTPVFCLHHLHNGYDVKALEDKDAQAQLALAMHKCAQLQWKQIHQTGRKASGTEMIPADQIKAPIPPKFADQDKFMAFRYNGKLPMVGVRINDVFHVLWVERQFGDVYDHGA